MKTIKFGNWAVTPEVVTHQKEGYEIPIDNFSKRVQDKDFFDWLTHVPIKTWMTREDTYALNTALLYVLAKHNIQLTKTMYLTNALREQDETLKSKDSMDKPITIEEIYRNIKGPRD